MLQVLMSVHHLGLHCRVYELYIITTEVNHFAMPRSQQLFMSIRESSDDYQEQC